MDRMFGNSTPQSVSARSVKDFVLKRFKEALLSRGLVPDQVPDSFDLLAGGIIDSLAIMEMIAAVEEQAGFEIDFEALDAEQLTIIGPFSEYVANAVRNRTETNRRG